MLSFGHVKADVVLTQLRHQRCKLSNDHNTLLLARPLATQKPAKDLSKPVTLGSTQVRQAASVYRTSLVQVLAKRAHPEKPGVSRVFSCGFGKVGRMWPTFLLFAVFANQPLRQLLALFCIRGVDGPGRGGYSSPPQLTTQTKQATAAPLFKQTK